MEVISSLSSVQFTFELLGCYGAVLMIPSPVDSCFNLHLIIQVFFISNHCKFMSWLYFTFQPSLYKQSYYSVVPTSRTSAGRGALYTSDRCLELWVRFLSSLFLTDILMNLCRVLSLHLFFAALL